MGNLRLVIPIRIWDFFEVDYALVNCCATTENHHVQWVNQLFLWPFSRVMLVYQRVVSKVVISVS